MDEVPIKRSQRYWDRFFMGLARQAALCSKDPDRKVGAVLASADRRQVSFGFNGFPEDVPDLPSLLADRDFKNAHMRHAEDNCLRQAPFNPRGCSLYVTRYPCLPCATKIVEAGVARLVVPERPDFGHARWGQSWAEAEGLLLRRGVYIISYNEE